MDAADSKALQREILLGFWKIHILHHAAEGPVVGQWMLQELRHHGYEVSPGTLYPLLHRMERLGWLRCTGAEGAGPKARRPLRATARGREVLAVALRQLAELQAEAGGPGEMSGCGRAGGAQDGMADTPPGPATPPLPGERAARAQKINHPPDSRGRKERS